jgi:hypothetical protein
MFFACVMITLCVIKINIHPEMEPDEQVTSDAIEANAISSPTSQEPVALNN